MNSIKSLADDGHIAIVGLRIASIVLTLPVVIAMAWAVKVNENIYTDGVNGALDIFMLSLNSWAFAWSTTAVVVRGLLHTKIHPGVYIAFDFIAFGGVTGIMVPLWDWLDPGNTMWDYSCLHGDDCAGDIVPEVEMFCAVFDIIIAAIHLFFFVWACWACHQWRRQRAGKGGMV